MDKLTKAGAAHYMRYHVLRTACSAGAVKDNSCWRGPSWSRAGAPASLTLLLLIFQALAPILVHWSL